MKQNCDGLTQGRLKSLLDYDPETGHFTWRIRRGCKAKGSRAGHCNTRDYIQIAIDGKRYMAHRLAVLWVLGRWPTEIVDHINCDPSDNRWANLREARLSENQRNSYTYRNNTSGFKGVSWNGRWRAQIKLDGEHLHIGYFTTREEAARAYDRACLKHHGEFAKTNAMMGLL